MAKRKSKLKAMAEAGNPWAIKTLARAQELGRAAAIRGNALQRASRQDGRVTIAFVAPISGLTLPSHADAEMALLVLEKAGVAVEGAHPHDDDIVITVLNAMTDDESPPWDEK